MGLKVKKKGSTLPPMDAGTYSARCVGMIDLGEQFSEKFKKYSDKILIIWEIIGQSVLVDGEEKPRWLSKDYSASLNEKSNLYQTLVSWRGKAFGETELSEDGDGFDLIQMLGLPCLMQVIVEEKEGGAYNKITSVIGVPNGMEIPKSQSELIAFDMDLWDDIMFDKLPTWVQDKMKKSTQYQKLHAPTDALDFPEDVAQNISEGDCPF